jgi:multidrug resistance efflux pump
VSEVGDRSPGAISGRARGIGIVAAVTTELTASKRAVRQRKLVTGHSTKIVRRFTVRIRLNAREPNTELARPGMSVETADATIGKECHSE